MVGVTTRGATSSDHPAPSHCDLREVIIALRSSAPAHHTLQISPTCRSKRMRQSGFQKSSVINQTPKHPNPVFVVTKKHPWACARTHTHTHLRLGFYIARKQPLSDAPPTFITSLRCPIYWCQVTAPSELGLNVGLHKFLLAFSLCMMLAGHKSYDAIKTGDRCDCQGLKLWKPVKNEMLKVKRILA